MDNAENGHILITALSAAPKLTKYIFRDKVAEAEQSPLALLQLLPEEELPDKIVVLCTQKILEEQYPKVKELIESGDLSPMSKKRISVSSLCIPIGQNKEELWQILQLILEVVPPNCRLTLDLTHGFRSYPFLFFTAALNLKALLRVEVKSVFYGMADVPGLEYKPILDISLILDMIEWFFAVRIFRETGQANNIIALLQPLGERPAGVEGKECAPYDKIKNLAEVFAMTADAYAQALPIEFGRQTAKLAAQLGFPLPRHVRSKVPLSAELFDQVKSYIEPFQLLTLKNRNVKIKLDLDRAELFRQAKLVDTYFEQGYVNTALGLIREWIVNSAIFHQHLAQGNNRIGGKEWLSPKGGRKPVEDSLNILMKHWERISEGKQSDFLTNGQKWLAERWKFISEKRNGLFHLGFRENNALLLVDDVKEIENYWSELKEAVGQPGKWNLKIFQGQGTLLISPLGNSKGLLFSALILIEPDFLFIVASETSRDVFEEITTRAGWHGEAKIYSMADAYAGFTEGPTAIREAEQFLSRTERVIVNLTGGTTVMQLVIQKIAQKFKEVKGKVETVVLVDRRPVTEQKENPYVTGELIVLEDA